MHVIELLPAYALGCLDAGEAGRVSEHLAGCATCQDELRAYQAVTGQLALAAPDAAPACRVKQQLMRRIEVACSGARCLPPHGDEGDLS